LPSPGPGARAGAAGRGGDMNDPEPIELPADPAMAGTGGGR